MAQLSMSEVLGEKFSLAKYMTMVNRIPDVSPRDIAMVETAFAKEMEKIIAPNQGMMQIKWDYRQLKTLLKNVSESGLKKKFAEATADATTIGITKTKGILSQGPGYNKRKQPISNMFIKDRLKRDSTNLSIYKLVAKNLNYAFDEDKGSIIGFVGKTMQQPLQGSREALLAPLVEGVKKGSEPTAPNFPVAASVNWTPYQAKWRESMIGRDFDRFGASNQQRIRVPRVQAVPFLDVWATHVIQATMESFLRRGLQ